jgi:hypothetical protein
MEIRATTITNQPFAREAEFLIDHETSRDREAKPKSRQRFRQRKKNPRPRLMRLRRDFGCEKGGRANEAVSTRHLDGERPAGDRFKVRWSAPGRGCSSSWLCTPKAIARRSRLSSEMFRACRSTWATKVLCSPASKANVSWDHSLSRLNAIRFSARTLRADIDILAGATCLTETCCSLLP